MVMGATTVDEEAVTAAYEDVRNDASDTQWAVLKYDGQLITLSQTGIDFDSFKDQFADDERAYGYIRLQVGDGLATRHRFLLVTWVGPSVSVLNRAFVSTDKTGVKAVISNFSAELQLQSKSDFDLGNFLKVLKQAGGTNYGS